MEPTACKAQSHTQTVFLLDHFLSVDHDDAYSALRDNRAKKGGTFQHIY